MVQILPQLRTLGDDIRETLAQVGASAGQAYGAHQKKKREKSLIDTIENPKSTDIEKGKAFFELGGHESYLKYRKTAQRQTLIDQLRGGEGADTVPTDQTSPPKQEGFPVENNGNVGQPKELINKEAPNQQNPSNAVATQGKAKQPNPTQQGFQPNANRQQLIQELAGVDPQAANVFQRQEEQAQKFGLAQQGFSQKEQQYREKQILPIQQEAMVSLDANKDQEFALENMLTSIRKGDVGIWTKANLSQILDDSGYKAFARAAETEGSAFFKTNSKAIFSGAKEIFPGRVTNFDAGIFQQMLPLIGRDEKANELAGLTLLHPIQIKSEKNRFTLQYIKDNPTTNAVELNSAVFDHMEKYRDNLYMQWHHKLEDFGLGQQQEKRKSSIFPTAPSQNKPRRSLKDIQNESLSR